MPRSDIEDTIDRAVQLGRDNRKLIGLIAAHCANARVVLEGGTGMVEAQTGLPIGMRSIRCDHAATPSGVAHNLAFLVEDFYQGNCVGCPHRRIRGIPNLATWYEERAAENARHAETERRVAEECQRSLESRQAVRRLLRLTENDAGRELLDLLDRLDGHKPVEDDHQDAEERLVATVRSAPDFLSTGIVDALFAVAETGEPAALRALTIWVYRAPRLADRLLHVAVHLLTDDQDPHATEVFVQLADRATPQDVEQIIDSLMGLAAQVIWWEPNAQPAGLLAAARVSLPVVLDAICRYLEGHRPGDAVEEGGPSPVAIAMGGCAAEHLILQEPGTASVLVPRLLDALPRTMHVRGLHPDPDALWHAVIRTLRAAFLMRPVETANAVDRVAPSRPVEEREHLFGIYAGVLNPRDGAAVPVEARRVALARVVARAMGDWGLDVAATAATNVEHLAASNPLELAGSGRALVGTLLWAFSESGDLGRRLEVLVDPGQRLEEEGQRMVRVRWIRSLAIAVGHLVSTDAEFAEVMTLYDATVTESIRTTEAARELRRRLLGAFPALATSPGQAARLMPRLYSALLDSDVGIRATAIDVCRRWVTGPGYALPELVRAFVPTLLDDKYVAVHRAMIRAIWAILPLHGDVRRIVLSLLGWAETYATKNPDLRPVPTFIFLSSVKIYDHSVKIYDHSVKISEILQSYKHPIYPDSHSSRDSR
jgi:hypothetical protein